MNGYLSCFVSAAIVFSGSSVFAQYVPDTLPSAPVSPQVVAPVSTITTTIQSPTGTTTIETPSTSTTQITTMPGRSVMAKSKEGSTIEMDSDNSVYVVYADGARTTASDGIIMLNDGTTITVKDGKRIP